MGMVCELRQISAAYARNLVDNPDEVLDYMDDFEAGKLAADAQGEAISLDKAWHGLHYLLTGTAWEGEEPSCYLVSEGEQVGDEEQHDVGYGPARVLSPSQVAEFSRAVNELTSVEIRRRFDASDMTKLAIYPEIWDRQGPDAQDNYDYLEQAAGELDGFLGRAVAHEKAVLVYFS